MGAIATKFDGIEYRSRLEAKWASFMHKLGWEYTYEPLDGLGYIPDFIVHGPRSMFVEVKPAVSICELTTEVNKVDQGLREYPRDILIVGVTPIMGVGNMGHLGAGLLGEPFYEEQGSTAFSRWFEIGEWFVCLECQLINVFHGYGSFIGRPCGHYDGDHLLREVPVGVIHERWAEACNEVKWRGQMA